MFENVTAVKVFWVGAGAFVAAEGNTAVNSTAADEAAVGLAFDVSVQGQVSVPPLPSLVSVMLQRLQPLRPDDLWPTLVRDVRTSLPLCSELECGVITTRSINIYKY